MKSWTPLWSTVVGSSLWDEPDWVMKVFLTMLALKDYDNIVRLTAYQLGRESRKTEQEVLDALKILSSPDSKRVEAQPYDGRRIKAVEEGWLILNGEKYRAMVQLEMKRARNRRAQAKFREKKKSNVNGHTPGPPKEPYSKDEHKQVREWENGQRATENLGDKE